jgi:GH25 family lysozyme M1 (1,4-beta-N-acetylmuramidase)
MTTIKGVDVASFQPETFATTGMDFVFVKATEGTSYINPKMRRQAATARTAGLGLGFYHFLHGGDVQAQARYFVDQCASLEGDMLVCDWETPPRVSGRAATCAEKDAFLRAVKALRPGHKVGLYCNTDYWLHRDSTSYVADFLWIADPNRPAGAPGIKHQWHFHQYAVSGGFDRNVGAFADRAHLKAWCGYPTAPKPPAPPAPKPPAPPAPAPKPPAPAPQPSAYDRQQDAELARLASDVKKLQGS